MAAMCECGIRSTYNKRNSQTKFRVATNCSRAPKKKFHRNVSPLIWWGSFSILYRPARWPRLCICKLFIARLLTENIDAKSKMQLETTSVRIRYLYISRGVYSTAHNPLLISAIRQCTNRYRINLINVQPAVQHKCGGPMLRGALFAIAA